MFAWLAGAAVVALVVDDPKPGEGGRAASLGFFLTFAAFSFLAGEYAWRGRRTALVAYRRPGVVVLDGDVLEIEAPGILSRPLALHRAWVETAEAVPGREFSATSFCPGFVRGVGVIRLRQAVGVPQALRPPALPRDPTRLPDPSSVVEAIALDFKDLETATEAIAAWAHGVGSTEPPEVPASAPRDQTTRNRRLFACAVFAAALASTYFTVPS